LTACEDYQYAFAHVEWKHMLPHAADQCVCGAAERGLHGLLAEVLSRKMVSSDVLRDAKGRASAVGFWQCEQLLDALLSWD